MEGMFKNCTSLTDIDYIYVGGTNDNSGKQMFYGCTSLEDASGVKFKSGSFDAGYQMFYGCTSLLATPDMSNITYLSSVNAMFEMYRGCSNLIHVYAPTVTWDTSKTENWLYGVSTSGIFTADDSTLRTVPTSNSGCPSGWTKSVL